MTRAIDRLLISGAIDESRETPIGWVLARLDCEEELAAAGSRSSSSATGRRSSCASIASGRRGPTARAGGRAEAVDEAGQLALFSELPTAPAPRGYRLPELAPVPLPPLHRVRRLSYSALALFERCSYRYYAERVAGLRERRGEVPGAIGLAATEIGDAVHRLLELVDLRDPRVPDVAPVQAWYPAVTDDELDRIGGFVAAYCDSELARRIAGLEGRARSGRLPSSTTASSSTGGSTSSTGTTGARSSSTTRRTCSATGRRPR